MEKREDEICDSVYLKLLNFLSFKQRSEKEILDRIEKYLSRTHLPSRELDKVRSEITFKLKEDGYLRDSNDLDFSQSYVSGLLNSKKSINKKKVSQFLFKRGVSRENIEKVLEDVSPDSFYEGALRDAKKKLKLIKDGSEFQKRRKLSVFLYRKGYSSEIISSVVDTLL